MSVALNIYYTIYNRFTSMKKTQIDLIEKIKRITLKALISDDYLFETLTLKGGNALNMIHKLNHRGSRDIDFSIEEDFTESFDDVKERIQRTLESTFLEEKYVVIDFHFDNTPEIVTEDLRDFWGGYEINFKIIDLERYELYKHDADLLTKRAIAVSENSSTKIEIDISKFEYVGEKERHEVDGLRVYVYAPIMILFEKVRAICQQTNEYNSIVKRTRGKQKGRARDFYDIKSIMDYSLGIDIYSEESQELLKKVFEAKRVPIEFIKLIRDYKDLHEENFQSVQSTISASIKLESFDSYFYNVVESFEKLLAMISKSS